MMPEQVKQTHWYEISIGWSDEKCWFLVDRMPQDRRPHFDLENRWRPREESVDVKTVNGATSEITIQAKFAHMPTLEDVMAVVLDQTHIDLSGEVKYNLTSRKEGLRESAAPLREDLERELQRISKQVL